MSNTKIEVAAHLKSLISNPDISVAELYQMSVDLKKEASRRLIVSGLISGAKVSYVNGNDGKTYIGFYNPRDLF